MWLPVEAFMCSQVWRRELCWCNTVQSSPKSKTIWMQSNDFKLWNLQLWTLRPSNASASILLGTSSFFGLSGHSDQSSIKNFFCSSKCFDQMAWCFKCLNQMLFTFYSTRFLDSIYPKLSDAVRSILLLDQKVLPKNFGGIFHFAL